MKSSLKQRSSHSIDRYSVLNDVQYWIYNISHDILHSGVSWWRTVGGGRFCSTSDVLYWEYGIDHGCLHSFVSCWRTVGEGRFQITMWYSIWRVKYKQWLSSFLCQLSLLHYWRGRFHSTNDTLSSNPNTNHVPPPIHPGQNWVLKWSQPSQSNNSPNPERRSI